MKPGDGVGKGFAFEVVVGDDDVNAVLVGEVDHVVRLDAAVEGNQQVDVVVAAVLDALFGDAVAFGVAVGDVEFDVFVGVRAADFAEEGVEQGDGRGAVHVVVAIDHDSFVMDDGFGESFHGDVHVFHQERVVQFFNIGFEEVARVLHGGDAALSQQSGERTLKMQMVT